MKCRLVAYTPLGARQGELPVPLSWTMVTTLNDMSTLEVSYPRTAPQSTLFDNPLEVAVEWHADLTGTQDWREDRNSRFILVGRGKDRAARQDVRTYKFLGLGDWLARKCLVEQGLTSPPGQRAFSSKTPGRIVLDIFDAAQLRGWGPGLTTGFGPQVDQVGIDWAHELTIAYEAKDTLAGVIGSLVEQGVVDYTWTGRALNLYNADETMARDLSTGDAPITIRDAKGVLEAPHDESLVDLATAAVVFGDEGVTWHVDNLEAPAALGRLEIAVDAGGITDQGTAILLANAELKDAELPRLSVTRSFVTDRLGGMTWPWRDYRLGDTILVEDDPAEVG